MSNATVMPDTIDGLPNIAGHEDDVRRAVAAGADQEVFRTTGGIDFSRVRAASAIALHMHQPLIPAGGGDLRTRPAIIGNLQHMLDNPGIGDNHNAPVFHLVLQAHRRVHPAADRSRASSRG